MTGDTHPAGKGARSGAVAYTGALAAAGGRELKMHESADDRSLLCAAIYVSPPYSLDVPPLPVPRLAVNLTSAHVRGGFQGDRLRSFNARRHSLFLTPAGQPVTWCKESPSRHLMVYFRADYFEGAGEHTRAVPALFNAAVPGIGQLVDLFTDELQTPGILNVEAADSLARLLLIRLARHLHRRSIPSYVLAPNVIARLRDYVTAHLGERILVADLARNTGLSPNYFAQSFTKQTGSSPHKFVMGLRVQRAAELLTCSKLSIAEIALDCGYSNQQHMCNVLRRHLGTTPSQIRALRNRSEACESGKSQTRDFGDCLRDHGPRSTP
jgi:AraC family transcriptional regulator